MVNIFDMAKYTILRLLQNGNSISPLKLQKILYYLQAWYLVYFHEELLFEDQPEAWVNGPVYRDVYEAYRNKGIYSQLTLADIGVEVEEIPRVLGDLHQSMNLSDNKWALIEQVLTHYGSMSQDRLVFLTHSQAPWNEARKGTQPFAYSDQKISFKTMYDYYSHAISQ